LIKRCVLSAFFLLSAQHPAAAWFFQPPPEAVSEETLASFREASTTALAGLAEIYSSFLIAESEDVAFSDIETTDSAIRLLQEAAALFRNLSSEQLIALTVSIEAVSAIDPSAVVLVQELQISTATDLADYSASKCETLAGLLVQLREVGFGPDTASSEQGRSLVNRISQEVSEFTVVFNSVSGALALSF
jgi:hypothetical protein